jgi:hypothetical protein
VKHDLLCHTASAARQHRPATAGLHQAVKIQRVLRQITQALLAIVHRNAGVPEAMAILNP